MRRNRSPAQGFLRKTIRASGHIAAAGAAILAIAQAAKADSLPDSKLDRDLGTLSLVYENDTLAGTDRNYTNGLLLSYLSGVRDRNSLTARLGRTLLFAEESDRIRFGVSLGQSIFTPEDISVRAPLGEQHPYAGWLYLGLSLMVESNGTLDTLSLEAGVVGPASGGEWAQKTAHRIVDATKPRGWDNQLENEPGVVLTYDRKWRGLVEWELIGLGIDVTPNAGLSLGNVSTQAHVGLTLRIGNDLTNDFGPPRVRPSLAGSGLLSRRDDFGWYLFAGVAGRLVAHNIFLDGNTTRESIDVERRPYVGDVQGGLVLQIYRYQLAFTAVTRSKEFETQGGLQAFGAISLAIKL